MLSCEAPLKDDGLDCAANVQIQAFGNSLFVYFGSFDPIMAYIVSRHVDVQYMCLEVKEGVI